MNSLLHLFIEKAYVQTQFDPKASANLRQRCCSNFDINKKSFLRGAQLMGLIFENFPHADHWKITLKEENKLKFLKKIGGQPIPFEPKVSPGQQNSILNIAEMIFYTEARKFRKKLQSDQCQGFSVSSNPAASLNEVCENPSIVYSS